MWPPFFPRPKLPTFLIFKIPFYRFFFSSGNFSCVGSALSDFRGAGQPEFCLLQKNPSPHPHSHSESGLHAEEGKKTEGRKKRQRKKKDREFKVAGDFFSCTSSLGISVGPRRPPRRNACWNRHKRTPLLTHTHVFRGRAGRAGGRRGRRNHRRRKRHHPPRGASVAGFLRARPRMARWSRPNDRSVCREV